MKIVLTTVYLGPPYDSDENDDYSQNQRDNERSRYNYNNPGGGNNNIRFPPNDDNNLHSVRPQVNTQVKLLKRIEVCL